MQTLPLESQKELNKQDKEDIFSRTRTWQRSARWNVRGGSFWGVPKKTANIGYKHVDQKVIQILPSPARFHLVLAALEKVPWGRWQPALTGLRLGRAPSCSIHPLSLRSCCQGQKAQGWGIVPQWLHCGEINRDARKYLYMSILVSEGSGSKRADPQSKSNSWGWR